MEYADFMNSFVVREDIFDDLTYLQKHLRFIVKIHQKLSSKLYITTSSTTSNGSKKPAVISKHFFAIRKFMDDLEDEMEDVSREQKILTDILKSSVSQYLEMLWKDCKIKVEIDVANGYITRALQFHYQKRSFSVEPTNVKLREPEDVFLQRYGEIHRLTLAERNIHPQQQQQRGKGAAASTSNKQQQSLLKPKFQKPSTSAAAASASTSSGRVVKKYGGAKKNAIIDTRHAKVIYQKQDTANGGRINLLRALTKVKTDQPYPVEFDENSTSSVIGIGKYNRSDEDCSDQSSYDGMLMEQDQGAVDSLKAAVVTSRKRRSPASNASSSDNANNWDKVFPPLPFEPPAKTEYNQEEFLRLFQLITPQVAEHLKTQRSKRKSRRNCVKNEKNDFHYGNFDLNEAAFRARMTNNKRSILYSPNNKRQ